MEFSNKMLAGILIIAIFLSAIGTFFSLEKLDRFDSITGMATTDNAKANVTIQGIVAMNTTNDIEFGDGILNEGGLRIISTTGTNSPGTTGFNDCTITNSSGRCAGIVIENTGNTYIKITVNASANATGTRGWLNGTSTVATFKSSDGNTTGDQGGCTGFTIDSFVALNTSLNTVCSNLSFASGTDKATFEMALALGPDTPSGYKRVTLEFRTTQI